MLSLRLSTLGTLLNTFNGNVVGVFLKYAIKQLRQWHDDEALFRKEVFGAESPANRLPGFTIKHMKLVLRNSLSEEDFITYDQFRRVMQYKMANQLASRT